jgi:hypothetical protein
MSQKALLFFASLLLSTSAVGSAGTAQAGPINWAQVIKLVNKVQFKPTNAGWRPAQGADRLQQAGDALFTSRGSRADLRLSEGSLLRMSSNTHLWIQPNSRNLLQRSGTALYVIKPGGGSTLISTPYGRAGVRGSALFVRVNEQTGTMIVGALTNNPAGDMEVTTENGPKQLLKAGQMAVVRGGQITMFDFDLKTFYQTSSLVQGFGLDGKPIEDADGTLADPEVQQTLAAVQAETLPALAAQPAVSGSNVAVNPEFLNSSPRDLKPADLVMQAATGSFDRHSPQTAAGIAAARQGININQPPTEIQAANVAPPPIPPIPTAIIQAAPAATGTIVPLQPTAPLPTPDVPPTPTAATVNPNPPTAVDPGRTPPTGTIANPATPAIPATPAVPGVSPAIPATPAVPAIQPVGQPNNPQLPVIQPIAQPPQAGNVNPTPINQPNQAGSVAPTRAEPQPVQAIRVEIRVEVEKSWGGGESSKVNPLQGAPAVQPAASVAPPPTAAAPPITVVTPPTTVPPVVATPVPPSVVVTPAVAIPTPATAAPDRANPTATPATPDPTLTTAQ